MTVEILAIGTSVFVIVVVVSVAIALLRRTKPGEPAAVPDPALASMRDDLASQNGEMNARIGELNDKLASLQENVTSQKSTLTEQVRNVGDQMTTISGLFTNDRMRGNWGEVSMVKAFECSGMIENRDYTIHFNAGDKQPDAVVHLPGECDVVVDSKFPIARYVEALESESPGERNALLVSQGKELIRVGKSLVNKGYADLASGGYIIMYLPSQAVYETACSANGEVINSLLEMRVIVAGPGALVPLLMNLGAILKEHRSIQQADQILWETKELQNRMAPFIDHLRKLGHNMERAVNAFNETVGSWTGRVEPQLTRIADLNGHGPDAEILPIDDSLREIPTDTLSLRVANE